ncbi:MAG: hypothetical protein IPJ04_14985 [Candidatus Eisenbacteria bacterium]|nr:hypothetical protein [Candidatus Eisenbacteria bacterium]
MRRRRGSRRSARAARSSARASATDALSMRASGAPAATRVPTSAEIARTTPGALACTSAWCEASATIVAVAITPAGARPRSTVASCSPASRADCSVRNCSTERSSGASSGNAASSSGRPPRSGWQVGQTDSGRPCSAHQSPLA